MNESFLAILAESARLRRMMRTGVGIGLVGLAAALGMGCGFSGGDGGDGDTADAGETETPRWPSGHLYRKVVTVTPPTGDPIAGFMLGIFSDGDAELEAAAKEAGADLLLTDSNDVAIPFELEYFDDESGAFAMWSQVTLSNRQFFLYYGRDEAVVQETNVWPSSMRGVWHSGTNNSEVLDSTVNNLAAVPTSGTATTEFGRVGNVLRFVDTSPRLAVDDTVMLSFGTESFTYSAWVFVENTPSLHQPNDQAWHLGGTNDEAGYAFELGLGQWSATVSDGFNGSISANFGNLSALSNDWVHLAAVVERGTTNMLRSYVNGVLINMAPVEGDLSPATGVDAYLGGEPTNCFVGQLDEVRVSAGALSATRLVAQHANQTNIDFLVFGDQESAPAN